MTDREKLVEMINHVSEGHVGNLMQPGGVEELAEYMIAHGVTVRQMQKPLTLEEVKNIRDVIVWAELVSGELFPARIDGTRLKNIEQWEDVWEVVRSSYKKGWRFWANHPTEEERQAAEWME